MPWKISVEIISMGHIKFLVKVKLTWVQDPGSSLKSSQRLPTNILNNICSTKIAQNQTNHSHWVSKRTISMAHTNFLNLAWIEN